MQQKYLKLLLETNALRFGQFKTKGGRISPYFLDSGQICDGRAAYDVGSIYARAFIEAFGMDQGIVLYGPAYKGIGLVYATSIALSSQHGLNLKFCYNRKERKDHGEGGILVGHQLQPGEKVVIVEDVLSRGTSVSESMAILSPLEVDVIGVLVGVDRQERGFGSKLASEEVLEKYPIAKIHAITSIQEIVSMLQSPKFSENSVFNNELKHEIECYLKQHSSS